MKHKAFTLIEAIVVVAITGILAAILTPVFSRTYCSARTSSCQSNLKQIGLAFLQYAQDYDEKFPPVANARAGYWAGSLQPYIKSWEVFQCPSEPKHQAKTTDYFYNARLANVQQKKLVSPTATLLAGDGAGDQLTLYHLNQLPKAWRTDPKSPAWRHLDSANYLFADGHAKLLKPEQITLNKPALGKPTFLVK